MNIYHIVTFVVSTCFSLFLVDTIKRLAIEYGFHDIPNDRKVHGIKVPTMGGLGLFGATWITMIVLNAIGLIEADKSTLRILSISIIFLLVGLVDDVKGVTAKSKFIIQIFSGVFFFLWNRNDMAILFNNIVLTNTALIVLSGFLFAVIINGINFIDGLDGLCAGVSLIFVSVLLFYSILSGRSYLVFLSISMMGAIAGFLVFNFYPAKIFMGDTGSLFLGSMFSMVIMLLSYHMFESWYAFAMLFTYPVLDLVLAVSRRVLTKKNLFSPDKNHMHHVILAKRTSHAQTVFFIYLVNIIFAAFSIAAFLFPGVFVFISYGIFSAALFVYALISMLQKKGIENAPGN